jgi:hypothetical protein
VVTHNTVLHIEMYPVQSSNIAEIGFDKHSRTLRIRFRDGGLLYDYSPVPASIYALLMLSKSKGSFFAEEIRPNFRATKVA